MKRLFILALFFFILLSVILLEGCSNTKKTDSTRTADSLIRIEADKNVNQNVSTESLLMYKWNGEDFSITFQNDGYYFLEPYNKKDNSVHGKWRTEPGKLYLTDQNGANAAMCEIILLNAEILHININGVKQKIFKRDSK